MTTTALRNCPRCDEKLRAQHDHQGAYWFCIQCGHHSYANVPPEPRMARSEAMKAYYDFFDYTGTEKAFLGYRLRGRLLPPVGKQSYTRFEIGCPYVNCRHPMTERVYKDGLRTRRRDGSRFYTCRNGHNIYVKVKGQTWR